ncbi:MAG: peptidyl-tRNA hydrolase Pth2 [Candidatus Marsarchaeota archaeon]|nr:peptidyl-tRNA hydrolase Pth2 [Candidatus Marsarchaeota archaeon]
MKQAIVLRSDLGMGKGKLVAQGAHASVECVRKSSKELVHEWLEEGSKKIVLKVSSEKELIELLDKCKKTGVEACIIADAGFTQIPSGTLTALAIGPDRDEKVDKITSKLKLL